MAETSQHDNGGSSIIVKCFFVPSVDVKILLQLQLKIILLPIYAAREKFDGSIKSENLADLINSSGIKKAGVLSMEEALKYCQNIKKDSLILTMGAGDVYKISDSLSK